MNVFKRKKYIFTYFIFIISIFLFNNNNVNAASISYVPRAIHNHNTKTDYLPENYNYFSTPGVQSFSSLSTEEWYWVFTEKEGQRQIKDGTVSFQFLMPTLLERYNIITSSSSNEIPYAGQFTCVQSDGVVCTKYNDTYNNTYTVVQEVPSRIEIDNLPNKFVILYVYDVKSNTNYPCNITQINGSNSLNVTCPNVNLNNEWWIVFVGRGFQNSVSRIGTNSVVLYSNALANINTNSEETNKKLEDIKKEQQETNKNIKDMNDTLKDDSIDNEKSSSFFDNFEDNDIGGISGIIIAPLNAIRNLTNSTCSPLNLSVPFVNKNITLPCMSTIYQNKFGTFYSIYRVIMFGLVSYFVCLRIFKLIHGFKDPNSDRIEVVDL